MIYRYRPQFYALFQRAMTRSLHTPYPALSAWARRTRDLVSRVYVAANAAGFDQARRQALILHLDRRNISMETILAVVRYHAAQEYPYLLGQQSQQNILTVEALNLNDRYLVLRLSQDAALQAEPLRARLAALREHLDRMPPAP
jgi:hypothetical protein